MADWHPEFRQFVPRPGFLNYPQAQGVINGLHIFLSSLEGGRPSVGTESATRRMQARYPTKKHFFILDRKLQDLYTMLVYRASITLVTVTAIDDDHALKMVDDFKPTCRFSDVDEIRLPYLLNCVLKDDPEFTSIRTPAGREIRLVYDDEYIRQQVLQNSRALEEESR